MSGLKRTSPRGLSLLAIAVWAVAACTSADERSRAVPTPSDTRPTNTVAAAEIGDRLTVTATVHQVLTRRSLLVSDADLTDDPLLVLGEVPAELRPPDLVTVEGVVARFMFDRFADLYQLTDPGPYRGIEGRKILVADLIRSRA